MDNALLSRIASSERSNSSSTSVCRQTLLRRRIRLNRLAGSSGSALGNSAATNPGRYCGQSRMSTVLAYQVILIDLYSSRRRPTFLGLNPARHLHHEQTMHKDEQGAAVPLPASSRNRHQYCNWIRFLTDFFNFITLLLVPGAY